MTLSIGEGKFPNWETPNPMPHLSAPFVSTAPMCPKVTAGRIVGRHVSRSAHLVVITKRLRSLSRDSCLCLRHVMPFSKMSKNRLWQILARMATSI